LRIVQQIMQRAHSAGPGKMFGEGLRNVAPMGKGTW